VVLRTNRVLEPQRPAVQEIKRCGSGCSCIDELLLAEGLALYGLMGAAEVIEAELPGQARSNVFLFSCLPQASGISTAVALARVSEPTSGHDG